MKTCKGMQKTGQGGGRRQANIQLFVIQLSLYNFSGNIPA